MAEPPHTNDHGLLNWEAQVFGPNPFPSDDPRHGAWRHMAAWVSEADERLKAAVLLRIQEGRGDVSSWTLEFLVGRFDIVATALLLSSVHDYEGAARLQEKLAEVADKLLGMVQSGRVPAAVQKQSLVRDIRSHLSQRSSHWLAEALKAAREAEQQVPQNPVNPVLPPSLAALDESPTSAGVFRQDANGDWELVFGTNQRVGVKHVVGMVLIRTLLAAPEQEFSASALVVAGAMPVDPQRAVSTGPGEDGVTEDGLVITNQGSQWGDVPALDKQALRETKAARAELYLARADAEANNNTEDYTRIEKDIEALTNYLHAGVGLRGPRAIGSDREKVRKAATARYRTALKVVRQSLPELAEHLEQSIQSGAHFRYRPDQLIDWLT